MAAMSLSAPVPAWQQHRGHGVGPRRAPRTRTGRGSSAHAGLDIAVPAGTPIRAVKPGCVVQAGWAGGYGKAVTLDHKDGSFSRYAHQSRILTSFGQCVAAGTVIGRVGSTGNSSGPHLHFEARTGAGPGAGVLDPLAFLQGRSRLSLIDRFTGRSVGTRSVRAGAENRTPAERHTEPRPTPPRETRPTPPRQAPVEAFLNFGHRPVGGGLFALHPSGVPVWADSQTQVGKPQWDLMPVAQRRAIADLAGPPGHPRRQVLLGRMVFSR